MATKIDKIIEIPLSKIHADFDWNSRSGDPAKSGDTGGESAENEFKSLVESIKARGQDQAVTVRPKGQSYSLVVGFRRFRAMQAIAEETGSKTMTILAVVKDLNDIEARSLNIRENTARKQLSPPELMKSMGELHDLYKAKGGAPTIDNIATEVGVGRPYASRLFKIRAQVHPKVLKAWQDAPLAVGVNKMEEIAKLEKDRHEEAFGELLKGTAGRGAGGGGGKKAWLTSAEKECERVGTLLGNLEREGLIDTDALDFAASLEHCIKMKDGDQKATDNQRKKLVEAITKAYETALNPPPPPEKPAKKEKGAEAAN